ncbi:MAG: hypothetical protein LBM98_09715 [Oscillospiraceae bacterium]|nr:hypothetical protein [Oscillospiraceae bacterium]
MRPKAPFRRRGCPVGAGVVPRYPRPNPYPLCGGVPPVAAGWFPRRAQPPSKLPSLISDICYLLTVTTSLIFDI